MRYALASDWIYLRRVLITLAVVSIAYLAWKIAALFILFFAAVLLAVLLGDLPGWWQGTACFHRAGHLP